MNNSKKITQTKDLIKELETRLNHLYTGFIVEYNEKERTFLWKNLDMSFSFDMYQSIELFSEINKKESLLNSLIEHLYKVNEFMLMIWSIQEKIERITQKKLTVKITHLAHYNGAFVTPRKVFHFCPINLFLSFNSAKEKVKDLTEIEHISAIFSHEYGHFLYNEENDNMERTKEFTRFLKESDLSKDATLFKLKEKVIENEKDAWTRGKELSKALKVREDVYQFYTEKHLAFLNERENATYKNSFYPYYKWEKDKPTTSA